MGSLLFKTLIGAIAGLVAWMIWEPSAPPVVAGMVDQSWAYWELKLFLTSGILIGGCVGGIGGLARGSRTHAIRGALLGGLFGLIGVSLGQAVAAGLVGLLNAHPGQMAGVGPTQVMSRVLAIAPIAMFIGAGIGASTLSVRGLFQGGLGGLIAGIISGSVFDLIGAMVGQMVVAARGPGSGEVEVGGPSRAVTFALLGLLIALFVGLAERVMRSAWVRLSLGRNEGKEWAIDRPQVLIGRSETANIPLFHDPAIAPAAAYILHKGGQYILADAGSPSGVYLNGQRVSQAPLFHGAHIQIGSTVLEFLMRAGATPQRGPEAMMPVYPASGPGAPGYGAPGYGAPAQPAAAAAYQAQQPAMNPTMMAPQAGMQPTQMAPMGAMQPTQMAPMGGMQPTQMVAPAQPGQGFALIALDGPLAGQKFAITGPIDLGRESQTVPMSYDSQASRRHATVSPTGFGVSVVDQGSTNGTFVNGQRVTQTEARAGDMVRVGQTTFRLDLA
jgi:pSer/pThr/pTyr-binding forkhead associated (FHA) protein